MSNSNPIGVFDSGVGGLSVFSKIIKLMPNENYIYFGDTINLPYGDKTKEELLKISSNIFEFFREKRVKAVIMACNTTSASVYNELKTKYNFEIYPIIQNVSKNIAAQNYKRIGVFATAATVNTHAYRREINNYNPNTMVFEIACPKWVSIVENSLQNEKTSIENIQKMLHLMLINNVEKIILGCTHYPYLMDILKKFAPEDIFIDPSNNFAYSIFSDLRIKNLLNKDESSKPIFFVSDSPEKFIEASKLFYNVEYAEKISVTHSII